MGPRYSAHYRSDFLTAVQQYVPRGGEATASRRCVYQHRQGELSSNLQDNEKR